MRWLFLQLIYHGVRTVVQLLLLKISMPNLVTLEPNRPQHSYFELENFKNGPSRPLSYLFSSLQTNITILQQNKSEKCPSSMRWWDSNPQSLEHECPPITTIPGLENVWVKLVVIVSFVSTSSSSSSLPPSSFTISVNRLGDLLDFGQVFKAFGNN